MDFESITLTTRSHCLRSAASQANSRTKMQKKSDLATLCLNLKVCGASSGQFCKCLWGCSVLQQLLRKASDCVKTVWPSGLRRWLKAPVRKGVGSNPTAVSTHGDKKGNQAPAHYARCGPAFLSNSPARAPRETYDHRRQTTKSQRAALTFHRSCWF